jgi:hypothetical protein
VTHLDDIVNLCREIDPGMSERMMIQHLMSGLNPDFKRELSRRESSMNTLNEFLKYAKIEQDLYDTFEKARVLSFESKQPYFDFNHSSIPSLTAMIKQSQRPDHRTKRNDHFEQQTPSHSSVSQRNLFPRSEYQASPTFNKPIRHNSFQSTFKNNQIINQSTLRNKFDNCKICGRKNHRTINCFQKRTNGCFNCGQNHGVRDCTMPPNFQ